MDHTRNFCIIAHIDHGKSTLADRMLELTGTVELRRMHGQYLDTMELEQEKGITIKLQPVQMNWTLALPVAQQADSQAASPKYVLNLIDTPGHVDFSYEVSRSLEACEGAVLVVDASQGIQAQTLANVYLAIEAGLTIIPVINKIDLPAAEPDRVASEISNLLGCEPDGVLRVSAKEGTGVRELLDRIVREVPPPTGQTAGPLRALIFDSVYDEYRGVILYLRVDDGELKTGEGIKLLASTQTSQALEVGVFKPQLTPTGTLPTGAIGYVVTNLRSVSEARVGDTVTLTEHPATQALPGYREAKPFVYAGFFPTSADDYINLKEALGKLKLNDAALIYTPESSQALGFGFRVGFLGLLHLEIVQQRLEREYNLDLVVTNPSTDYEVVRRDGTTATIRSASELPDPTLIAEIREPWISGEIVVPTKFIGNVITLISNNRGLQKNLSYLDETLALVTFESPLSNVLTDFYDNLKSLTSGYGSFNYELDNYRTGDLVRLDILVGGELIDTLGLIVHATEALPKGRTMIAQLKEAIPRQLFEVTLQAAIGGKIIARENISAMGKNVTAKLYGGDITRKHKLLDKQKAGKKRLKRIGKVDIPAEAFMTLVKKGQ